MQGKKSVYDRFFSSVSRGTEISNWHSVGWGWMTKDAWQDPITRLCVIDAFSSKSFWFYRMLKHCWYGIERRHWNDSKLQYDEKPGVFTITVFVIIMISLIIANVRINTMHHDLIINNKVSQKLVLLYLFLHLLVFYSFLYSFSICWSFYVPGTVQNLGLLKWTLFLPLKGL